jgi:hypothetical protein
VPEYLFAQDDTEDESEDQRSLSGGEQPLNR